MQPVQVKLVNGVVFIQQSDSADPELEEVSSLIVRPSEVERLISDLQGTMCPSVCPTDPAGIRGPKERVQCVFGKDHEGQHGTLSGMRWSDAPRNPHEYALVSSDSAASCDASFEDESDGRTYRCELSLGHPGDCNHTKLQAAT